MPRAKNSGRRLIKPRRGMVWDKEKQKYVDKKITKLFASPNKR